jgi:quercetin dioxygenase-like cupin family protein
MFIDPNKLSKREILQGVNLRTAWGEKVMIAFIDIEPGSVIPPHNHPHEQMGMVLEGKLEFTIGQESKLLQPGDAYLVPSGVEHSVKVIAGPARALDIFSPPREDYK